MPRSPGAAGSVTRETRNPGKSLIFLLSGCMSKNSVAMSGRRVFERPLAENQPASPHAAHSRRAPMNKNTICLWYNHDAEEAAQFYAKTFPNSSVDSVHKAPSNFPGGKAGQVLTVQFTVCGIPCMGLNGGDMFKQSEAFSFQIATEDQAETDRYWNAIVGNDGKESACGWCKDKWGVSWQITPRVLTDAMAQGGDVAKRAFAAMMPMGKIDV